MKAGGFKLKELLVFSNETSFHLKVPKRHLTIFLPTTRIGALYYPSRYRSKALRVIPIQRKRHCPEIVFSAHEAGFILLLYEPFFRESVPAQTTGLELPRVSTKRSFTLSLYGLLNGSGPASLPSIAYYFSSLE